MGMEREGVSVLGCAVQLARTVHLGEGKSRVLSWGREPCVRAGNRFCRLDRES